MRIVSGSARGRGLQGPKGPGIRPTADRVRESLFNVLGQTLEPIQVLDLYAGTGALGLEAVSRGAAGALLVDSGREAIALCRANTEALGFASQVEVWPLDVARALERLKGSGRRFGLVFADPPYAAHAGRDVLEGVAQAAVLEPGAIVAVEHDKREILPVQAGLLTQSDQREYGDTRITLFVQSGQLTAGNF